MSAADAAGAARRESYNEDCLPMIRPLIALISVILVACTTQHRRQAVGPPVRDTPIGTILKQYAVQRSYAECKAKNLSAEEC